MVEPNKKRPRIATTIYINAEMEVAQNVDTRQLEFVCT
jgi:hypothetical protein